MLRQMFWESTIGIFSSVEAWICETLSTFPKKKQKTFARLADYGIQGGYVCRASEISWKIQDWSFVTVLFFCFYRKRKHWWSVPVVPSFQERRKCDSFTSNGFYMSLRLRLLLFWEKSRLLADDNVPWLVCLSTWYSSFYILRLSASRL